MNVKKEEPLLVMQYEAGKVLWRLFFPNGLAILLFGAILIDLFEKVLLSGCNMKDCYILIIFSFLVFGGILVTIEMLLVKEIRFYKDRIEKEWSIFGIKSLKYSNAKIRGITSWFASSKGFLYIKKPKWYQYKCCVYDEHLISKENKEKAIKILANISNRNINEFTKSRLEINPLIKNKG